MMSRTAVRTATVAALVAGFVAVQQLPAEASGGGKASFDDRQVVQLVRDGAERGRGALVFHQTSRDAVVAGNAAVATSSCDGCHATAISFQVVLADKAPTSLQVGNIAIADNEGCVACESDAFAYQFVLATGDDAAMTGAGRRQLANIGIALSQLSRSGGSPDEIECSVKAYAEQVVGILTSELRVRPAVHRVVQKHYGPRSATA
jgi:hypothetical protein